MEGRVEDPQRRYVYSRMIILTGIHAIAVLTIRIPLQVGTFLMKGEHPLVILPEKATKYLKPPALNE
jgi:hypothetical protein